MNINYSFVIKEVKIDEPNNVVYGVTDARRDGWSAVENMPGFQRDEIYRFGIVFFDSKGKNSFVEFIEDIRIPDVDVYPLMKDDVTANSIHIEFNVSDLPQGVVGYQIVYVPRTAENRTVVDMGYVNGVTDDGFIIDPEFLGWRRLEYTSPEILYNKLELQSTHIERVAISNSETGFSFDISGTERVSYLYKFRKITSVENNIASVSRTERYQFTPDKDYSLTFEGLKLNAAVNGGADRLAIKGTCDLLLTSSLSDAWRDADRVTIARRRRGIEEGQPVNLYGNIDNNVFIPCSKIVKAGDNAITWGDIYVDYFEFNRYMYPLYADEDKQSQFISIPVETTINLVFKNNPTVNSLLDIPDDVILSVSQEDAILGNRYYFAADYRPPFRWMQEGKGLHAEFSGSSEPFFQDFDLYTYNTVYSRQSDLKQFNTKPETIREDSKIDTRIYHSDRKVNVELEDSWLIFRSFLDVDTAYGAISKLVNFKNNVYYFQSKGYGALSIDQRELTQTNLGTSLTLGQGGILDRFDYLSTTSGTDLKDSIVVTALGIYYVDNYNKAICRVGETPEFITDLTNMKSWIKKRDCNAAIAGYDANFKMVYFKVDNEDVLCYNENLQRFTEFYTVKPDNIISVDSMVLFSKQDNIHKVKVSERGRLLGDMRDSKLVFVVNPEGRFIQRLDVIELLTYVFNGDEELQETISTIRVYNSYQDTGVMEMDAVRRFRNWRINTLRDESSEDDARLKDTYFIVELTFNNEQNKEIKLHDVVVNHFPIKPY